MATKTKTFKIGEYCKGGIITVEVTGKIVTIIGKDWDYSKGSNADSDQSNAKEFTRGTQDITESNAYRNIITFLNDLTTHYYSEKVFEWIEKTSGLKKQLFW